MKKLLILCLLALLLLQSCQKTEVIDEVTQNGATINAKLSLTDATVQNGYLVFESTEHYYNALSEASKMTDSDFAKWANSVGFRSMQVRYNKMLTEYEALGDNAQSLDEVLAFRESYSDVAVFEETGEVDIKCAKGIDAHLLDTKGMVKIGKDLLIYTPTKEIRIIGGDEAKLAEALHTNTSNQTAGILVNPIIVVVDNERSGGCGGEAITNVKVNTKTTHIYENGNQKYKLTTELWALNTDAGTNSTASIGFKAFTYKRGLFGAWYAQKTDLDISSDIIAMFIQTWYTPAPNAPAQYVNGSSTAGGHVHILVDDSSSWTNYPFSAYATGNYYLSTIINGGLSLQGQGSHWEGCFDYVEITADFPGSGTSLTHIY